MKPLPLNPQPALIQWTPSQSPEEVVSWGGGGVALMMRGLADSEMPWMRRVAVVYAAHEVERRAAVELAADGECAVGDGGRTH